MAFQTKRFSLQIDEVNYIKVLSILGKSSVQQKDFEVIVKRLIERTYDQLGGKPLK